MVKMEVKSCVTVGQHNVLREDGLEKRRTGVRNERNLEGRMLKGQVKRRKWTYPDRQACVLQMLPPHNCLQASVKMIMVQ